MQMLFVASKIPRCSRFFHMLSKLRCGYLTLYNMGLCQSLLCPGICSQQGEAAEWQVRYRNTLKILSFVIGEKVNQKTLGSLDHAAEIA